MIKMEVLCHFDGGGGSVIFGTKKINISTIYHHDKKIKAFNVFLDN